jgi:hypothetical protein
LKSLQSELGEFKDACVQASWLRHCAGELDEREYDAAFVRQAADRAARRAEALRKLANRQLLRFGEPATRAAFERVFHVGHSTGLVQ